MKWSRWSVGAAVVAAVLMLGGGLAVGQAISSPDTIYACANANGSVQKLRVNAPPSCGNNQTLYAWEAGENTPPMGGGDGGDSLPVTIPLPPQKTGDGFLNGGSLCTATSWGPAQDCFTADPTQVVSTLIDDRYGGQAARFDVYASVNVCARLFDVTNDEAIAGTEICFPATGPYQQSGTVDFTLPAGEVRVIVQVRSNEPDYFISGTFAASLIVG